ncbi:MAG: hypothetical protein Q4G04_05165 [bacterium]|nr:hypothetical protein [bacterium]
MRKKIIVLLISILAITLPNNKVNAINDNTWFGDMDRIDISWYDSNTSYHEIENASQLAGLAYLTCDEDYMDSNFASYGHTFSIIDDIDVSDYEWAPMCYFAGTLMGNNHTISGINVDKDIILEQSDNGKDLYIGFIEETGDSNISELKLTGNIDINITSESSNLAINSLNVGSLSAKVYNSYIYNVHNYVNINISTSNQNKAVHYIEIGGLVSYLEMYTENEATINESSNHGNITVTGNTKETLVGGIVGYIYNDKIMNSYNYGNISVNNIGNTYTGGLVSYIEEGAVVNSYNSGNINSTGATESLAGGIVGYSDYYSLVYNTYNTGIIESNKISEYQAGNILGAVDKNTIYESNVVEDYQNDNYYSEESNLTGANKDNYNNNTSNYSSYDEYGTKLTEEQMKTDLIDILNDNRNNVALLLNEYFDTEFTIDDITLWHKLSFKNASYPFLPRIYDTTEENLKLIAMEVALPDYTYLDATEIEDNEEYQEILKNILTKYIIYDLNLEWDGYILPNGNVLIGIPLPDGYNPDNIAVYRIDDDGTLTEYSFNIENNIVYFETDHFSIYTLGEKLPTVEEDNIINPKTSDIDISGYEFMMLFGFLGVSFGTFKIVKKYN